MSAVMRHIVALVCLVAFVCGGPLSVCACDLLPPAVACESHDHSDHATHDDTTSEQHSDCDTNCPCATCHSCSHTAVVLPDTTFAVSSNDNGVEVPEIECAPSQRSADIFTPPKLS